MAPELLIVLVASGSCVAFCLVILMLVVALYRKDPLCCIFRPSTTEHYTDDPPHYHSRHSLTGITNEHSTAMNQGATGAQFPGRLFIIGKPNDYHLNGALPRLPSYESVRKKDRQRHIHSMISQRFGLSGCHDEPPPTYEETLRQSLDILPVNLNSLDVHLSMHPQDHSSNLTEDTHNPIQPPTPPQEPASSRCPAHSSTFLSI
ncbi:uncharacterized protein LOC117247720 [Epinephelus lanceolatus]|uniref:uncharacterized protein LOC117247720 n=1 Tax=Epinephelus lanceolatus TaxID=310571 RepID=UPI001447D423|nr:uncharacterized protein LOC117247720 [Epinephelus lanceolatus]